MSSKRMLGITIAGVILIALIIVSGVLLLNAAKDIREIPLPDVHSTTSPDYNPSGSGTVNNGLTRVEVTTDTVQAVIKTLARPESYSRDLTIEKFYNDGAESKSYTVSTHVFKGVTAVLVKDAGLDKTIIVTADTVYIWYKNDSEPYKGPLGSSGDGTRTSDEYQMIMNYGEILSLKPEDILEAGYTPHNGQDCIYVIYQSGSLGYLTKCYISVALGLIIGAEQYDIDAQQNGETLIYRMTAGACDQTEPDQELYVLPDGTNVISGL
jgi:hypothetical protein